MKILGIDPGVARVGWGLVESKESGNKLKYLKKGLVETDSDVAPEKRLKKIYQKTFDIIKKTDPEVVGVEKLYFFKNQKTAFAVSQARGVIILAATDLDKKIYHYTPLQIKQAVTGYGRASKKQIQEMVKQILVLKKHPKPDDVADALAVCICCSSDVSYQKKINSN